MEDQRGRMDSDTKKIPAIGERPLSPKRLTVMVIRSVGKMRSFKISKRLVLFSTIFIIIYLLSSLYIINDYFRLRYLHNIQSEKLSIVESDNVKFEKELLQTKQHVAILEDYVENTQVQSNQDIVTSKGTESGAQVVTRIAEEVYHKKENEDSSAIMVKVEDFIAKEEDSEMSIDFRLVNNLTDETAAEGYIHIIASDNDGHLFPEWNYTENMLKNGSPVNFRRGQPFLIQRFKPYHRIFIYNSNSELPSAITIVVYDRAGKQILENEFKVSDVS